MKRALAFAAVLLTLASLGVLGALPAGAADRTVAIKGALPGQGFQPAEVTVSVGDSVKWTNEDISVHTATSSGEFNSGDIASGGNFKHTFTKSGVFSYLCTKHSTMRGTINVTGGPSSPPPSSPPSQTQKPSPTPSPSKSPTTAPTLAESPTPSPSEVVTGTVDSAAPTDENKDEGGPSGGTIAAIIAGVVAIGSGIGLFLMRRTPA